MKGQRIGYIRVSSTDQNPDRQLEGVETDKLFIDHASGKDTQRPQLEAMLAYAREGDMVVFSLITEALVLALVVSTNYGIYYTNALIIVITFVYFISLFLLGRELLVLNKNMKKKWESDYFDELTKKWQDICSDPQT